MPEAELRAPGLDDMTYRQAFMICCSQCLALWPGFSRSGATISGGMLMGVSRYAASEFVPAGGTDDDGRNGARSSKAGAS